LWGSCLSSGRIRTLPNRSPRGWASVDGIQSTQELLHSIAVAMEAYQDAFDKAKILHRDISVENIIKADGKGMLIDWDLSLDLSHPRSSARRLKRTGTWQFIPARLLMAPSLVHELADDPESAFWVLLWLLLRYTEHNLSPDELADDLRMFDKTHWVNGASKGGNLKERVISSNLPSRPKAFKNLAKPSWTS